MSAAPLFLRDQRIANGQNKNSVHQPDCGHVSLSHCTNLQSNLSFMYLLVLDMAQIVVIDAGLG